MTACLIDELEDPWRLDSYNPVEIWAPSWMKRHPVKSWKPASVLDTFADLPEVQVLESPIRLFPFVEWHRRAACRGMDSAKFFGEDETGKQPSMHPSVLEKTRKICKPCPVATDCLTHALVNGEVYGVWASTSGRQRKKLQERISRGEGIAALVTECLGG